MTWHDAYEEPPPQRELMTPSEVAWLFGVRVETVRRWANRGFLGPVHRTLGGRRRFEQQAVMELYEKGAQ